MSKIKIYIFHFGIFLGHSDCCQHITVSSELLKDVSSIMGDYEFYGNDPDGARVYHNPKSNMFITRDHAINIWEVN